MKPSPLNILLVFCGGGVGATVRVALTALFPTPAPTSPGGGALEMLPITVLIINWVGALLLGALTGALSRYPDSGIVGSTRLALGTGMLGGFTTYSSFALALAQLGIAGQIGAALMYLTLSLAGGYLMAWAGLTWGKNQLGKLPKASLPREQGNRP